MKKQIAQNKQNWQHCSCKKHNTIGNKKTNQNEIKQNSEG